MDQYLRDPVELEGALLVEAQAVVEVDSSGETTHVVNWEEPKVALGIPDFQLDNGGGGLQTRMEEQYAREGTYRGRVQAIEEIEAIQRTNRDAAAQVKLERQRITAANINATGQWLGAFDPPVVEAPKSLPKSIEAKPPTASSASGGYQVSEYTISQYDTAPYETTEYKTIYE